MKLNRKIKSKLLKKQIKDYLKAIRETKKSGLYGFRYAKRALKGYRTRMVKHSRNFSKVIVFKGKNNIIYKRIGKLTSTKYKIKSSREEYLSY